MRIKLSLFAVVLCATTAWGQITPEKAEQIRLKSELEYFNVESVRNAYKDFCKSPSYDSKLYGTKLSELERLAAKNDAQSQAQIVKLKREILLSNPLLDNAKIIVGRYRVGENNGRRIMAPSLGTQNNNWSNQSSSARSGFDAEIAELSNLRGEIKSRTIFKPANGSSVADLLLHWDGERILFTAVGNDNKWGVFEVNRDGSNFHRVINSEEPDLEFFDGAYMPSGRIIAMSNIGYQGVPCVNGDDPVGNMIAYEPATGAMRRMTFDQDANWHPRVMNNGRLMYVRWEYTDLTHYYSRFVMHANPDGTEIPDNESVDKFTIQTGFVALAYAIAFGFMYLLGILSDFTNSIAWGFNFLWASIAGMLIRAVVKVLRKRNLMHRQYINNYQMDRISGFAFDLMIVAGVAAIEINDIKNYVLPIVILSVVGAAITYVYIRKVSKECFKGFEHEFFLMSFGTLTGTASNGMILLKEIDPGLRTPTSSLYILSNFPAMVMIAPLLFLLGFASKSLTNALIALAIFFVLWCVYTVFLFRRRIFKKKYKGAAAPVWKGENEA